MKDAYIVKGSIKTNISNIIGSLLCLFLSLILLYESYYIFSIFWFYAFYSLLKDAFKNYKDDYIKITDKYIEINQSTDSFNEKFMWKNIDKIVIVNERDIRAKLKIMKVYTRQNRLYDDFPIEIILDNFDIDVKEWCDFAMLYNPKLNLTNKT